MTLPNHLPWSRRGPLLSSQSSCMRWFSLLERAHSRERTTAQLCAHLTAFSFLSHFATLRTPTGFLVAEPPIISLDIHRKTPAGSNGLSSGRLFITFLGTTRWSSRVSPPLNFRALRDQICTTFGPKVNCASQIDF